MPKRYTLAALAGAMALFAAPALADGYPGKPVQRGPEPLTPHVMQPPGEGCVIVEQDIWSCPASGESHTRRYIDESLTRHYVNRYTTGGICCGGSPPPPRVIRKSHVERGLSIDIAGFDGGVGNGVDGGYYGGGGGFAYASASSSASAFARASAYMSFRGSFKGGHGKRKGGGCHVCGGKKGGGGKR